MWMIPRVLKNYKSFGGKKMNTQKTNLETTIRRTPDYQTRSRQLRKVQTNYPNRTSCFCRNPASPEYAAQYAAIGEMSSSKYRQT